MKIPAMFSAISFRAIELDKKSRERSNVLLDELNTASSDCSINDLKSQLCDLYNPYFKKESKHHIIPRFASFRPDYVQKLHLSLLEACDSLKSLGELNTDALLVVLNSVRPEKTEARVHKSRDFQAPAQFVNNFDIHYSYEEIIPESQAYTYVSSPSDEERDVDKQKLNTVLNDVSLTQNERKVLEMRSDGLSYNKIASLLSFAEATVRQYVLSGIAKIQRANDVLPQEFFNLATGLKNRYKLNQTENEIIESLLPFAKFATKDIDEIFIKIDSTSKLINLPPEKYADMLIRRFELLAYPPETIKKKVDDFSELLNLPHARVSTLFSRIPVMLTENIDTYKARIKNVPKVLDITTEQFKTMARKDIAILAFNEDFFNKSINDTSEALGVTKKIFVGMCKQIPELLYLKSENLKNKLDKGAELLGVSVDEYRKMCVSVPALLVYSPNTILKKAQEISKLFSIDFEQAINLAKSQPVILVKKLETLKRNLDEAPSAYNVTKDKFMQMGMKNPAFFVRDPSSISKKVAIADFYKKVRNQEDGEISIRTSKDEVLYQNILMYLVRQQDKPKLLNATNFVDYINEQPEDKIYTFSIPNDNKVAEDFVEFVKIYSQNNFGKQRFLLQIINS